MSVSKSNTVTVNNRVRMETKNKQTNQKIDCWGKNRGIGDKSSQNQKKKKNIICIREQSTNFEKKIIILSHKPHNLSLKRIMDIVQGGF